MKHGRHQHAIATRFDARVLMLMLPRDALQHAIATRFDARLLTIVQLAILVSVCLKVYCMYGLMLLFVCVVVFGSFRFGNKVWQLRWAGVLTVFGLRTYVFCLVPMSIVSIVAFRFSSSWRLHRTVGAMGGTAKSAAPKSKGEPKSGVKTAKGKALAAKGAGAAVKPSKASLTYDDE